MATLCDGVSGVDMRPTSGGAVPSTAAPGRRPLAAGSRFRGADRCGRARVRWYRTNARRATRGAADLRQPWWLAHSARCESPVCRETTPSERNLRASQSREAVRARRSRPGLALFVRSRRVADRELGARTRPKAAAWRRASRAERWAGLTGACKAPVSGRGFRGRAGQRTASARARARARGRDRGRGRGRGRDRGRGRGRACTSGS